MSLYHFDFYRLASPEEFLDAGLDEYFSGAGVCFVEWPRQASPYLAPPDVVMVFAARDGGRAVTIQARTEAGRICVKQLTDTTAAELARQPG
jgi:tRNA threonylcarbamoyladenosine biosynthesis protein TsaE